MLATATITYDLSDYGLADFDSRRTKVWATNNVSGPVVDTEGNLIHLGSANGTVNADGTGSITVPTPGTGSNPASWQTTIHVDYPDRNADRGRGRLSLGPFTITVSGDLADLIQEQAIPPDFSGSGFIAEVEAIRDSQVDLSGISTSDGVVEALVKNTAGAGPLTSAAVAAAVDARNGRVYTPEQFGAVGDGTTDDGAAFASAYAALPVNGTLLLRPGKTYYARLVPASNTKTVGHGAIVKAPTGSTAIAVNASAKVGVSIEGLAIDGNGVATHGVHTTNGTTDITLTDVEVYGCTERGVHLENVVDAQLTRVLARNNGASSSVHAGINIHGQRITLTDCIARSNTVGFRLISSATVPTKDVSMKGCVALDNTRYGFVFNAGDFANRPERITLTGSIARGNGGTVFSGFALHGVMDLTVTACVAEANGEHGITVQDAKGVTITGCVVTDNRGFGIRLQGDFSRAEDAYTGVRDAVVSGNMIARNGVGNPGSSTGYGGVFIDTAGEDILLAGNLFVDNTGSAIRIAPRVSFTDPLRVVCDGNTLRDNLYTVVLTSVPSATTDTYSGYNYEQGVKRGFGSLSGAGELAGTAAPTTGTWVRGDRVWNTTPAASGTMGWVCTTAGTPGTWKTFGAISA